VNPVFDLARHSLNPRGSSLWGAMQARDAVRVSGRARCGSLLAAGLTRANEAWKAAKLTPITPHEARHSAASYLIEAGLNDLELTATIGHSDPRTTKTIYGHLFPDSASVIAAKMDLYLDASPGTAKATNQYA